MKLLHVSALCLVAILSWTAQATQEDVNNAITQTSIISSIQTNMQNLKQEISSLEQEIAGSLSTMEEQLHSSVSHLEDAEGRASRRVSDLEARVETQLMKGEAVVAQSISWLWPLLGLSLVVAFFLSTLWRKKRVLEKTL